MGIRSVTLQIVLRDEMADSVFEHARKCRVKPEKWALHAIHDRLQVLDKKCYIEEMTADLEPLKRGRKPGQKVEKDHERNNEETGA